MRKADISVHEFLEMANTLFGSPIFGVYGQLIAGMRPGITNSHPQPLEPVTAYRLFVEAGRAKGQIDFRTSGIIEPAN